MPASTWMTELYTLAGLNFGAKCLREITIPGTHDAGCFIDHPYGNMLSRTQMADVAGQLAGGVRYFDIRPYQANYVSGRSFWTYHGPYSGGQVDGVGGILQNVANFIDAAGGAGRELILLNISHFRKFGNDDHAALINQITTILGARLVPRTQNAIDLFETNYTQLLTNPNTGAIQSRVAILYDGALDQPIEPYVRDALAGANNIPPLPSGFFVLSPKYVPAANPIYLFDQYANKWWVDDGLTTTGMRTDQLTKLRQRANYLFDPDNKWGGVGNWPANTGAGTASTLHLFSWTLTPQLRPGISRDPVYVAQVETNPALLDVFVGPGRGWAGPIYQPGVDPRINIIYIDNFGTPVHRAPTSPWDGMPMVTAIAARLNVGALTW